MCLGVLTVCLYINESNSLKFKRQVLRCLKDRIKANFNVSVSEIAEHALWQRSCLGIACIGKDKPYVNGVLSRVFDLMDTYSRAEVIDTKMELY
ncbi:MAG: DUF503 domain-containing protein [Candidatus Omnitrophica bacterium]|nr:DUF503 domain-containing protein [Candidatus Omnitrophota bacterium]